MALVVPYVGEVVMLNNILNKVAPQNLDLRLYKSDVTPAEGDTETAYITTNEADFTGYAEKALTGASWTVTAGTGGNPSYATAAQQEFLSTADAQNVSCYGYFFTQATSGILMWAERFTSPPYTIVNDGDSIKVTPYFSLD